MTVRADDRRRAEVRALWAALEPLHAVMYFADEHAAAMKQLGLKGWWMGYFASRSAPLGRAPAASVGALFYPFKPSFVARALPDAWLYASPSVVLQTRQRAVERSLELVAQVAGEKKVADLGDRLVPIAAAADCAGRPLAAANQQLGPPSTLTGRLWWAIAVLREHRGDGHVAALVTHGVGRLEALVLACAGTGVDPEVQRVNRGWTEREWADTTAALTEEGLLAGTGLTSAGRDLLDSVERVTDTVAGAAWPGRDDADLDAIWALGRELSEHVIGSVVPVVNPIGTPWPPPALPTT